MSSNITNTAIYYDTQVKTYDAAYSNPISDAEDIVLAQYLKTKLYGEVLDIGCGTGLLLDLVDSIDHQNFVGIDVSPGMIAGAKEKYPTASFHVGDMHTLQFQDNAFDTVVSLFGPISYASSQEKILKELMRVLKPGGTFIIMPYSARVPTQLDTGFSTALNPDIQKEFYTSAKAQQYYGKFRNFEARGFNFFANRLADYYYGTHGTEIPTELAVKYLEDEWSNNFLAKLPIELARHTIISGQKSS